MANKPYGIDPDNRVEVPAGNKNAGVDGGDGIFNEYWNQLLFELQANHIWGTEAQVKDSPPTATFYTDGAGGSLNKSDSAVTILKDDKILIRHNTTQTANLLLDCGGVKVAIEMYGGITLDMDTFDLTLGVTANDEFEGSIRVISDSSAETITVLESSGLRVDTGMSVSNLSGDVIVNNTLSGISSANIDAKELKIEYTSASTVTTTADSLKLVSDDNQSVVVNTISEVPDISVVGQRQNGAGELSDARYNLWVGSTAGGAIETKYLPVLSATTDGTTTNELVDSSENFTTHLAAIGDKVFNNTDGTFAFVTAVTNSASGRLLLDADIFVSGDDYTIELRSPTFSAGYTFKANVGSVENVSGNFYSNTVKFFGQTIIRRYNGDGADFSITGPAGISTNENTAFIEQDSSGEWIIELFIDVSHNANQDPDLTVSGITFKTGVVHPGIGHFSHRAFDADTATYAPGGSGVIEVNTGSGSTTRTSIYLKAKLDSKPTWTD